MEINADLGERALVDSNGMDWVASPERGVERKMLDRDGGEVARATTIVR
ncbi:MAG: cupin, partial [SAR324 cluster bacterium]|nr:cupin [SAR324 cluster bacterium]